MAPPLQIQLFKEAVKNLEAIFDECSRAKEREKTCTASGIPLNPLTTSLATVKSMANTVEQATVLMQASIVACISQILLFCVVFVLRELYKEQHPFERSIASYCSYTKQQLHVLARRFSPQQ